MSPTHCGDTLMGRRSRTVPLVAELVPLVDARPATSRQRPAVRHSSGWHGRRGDRKRPVGWTASCQASGRPTLRVHDLRHTAPRSGWAGADPKVMQRILGRASAAMTMDLYGHLIDHNLWVAADKFGDTTGAPTPLSGENEKNADEASGASVKARRPLGGPATPEPRPRRLASGAPTPQRRSTKTVTTTS